MKFFDWLDETLLSISGFFGDTQEQLTIWFVVGLALFGLVIWFVLVNNQERLPHEQEGCVGFFLKNNCLTLTILFLVYLCIRREEKLVDDAINSCISSEITIATSLDLTILENCPDFLENKD